MWVATPVAELLVRQLQSGTDTPHLGAAVAARALEGVQWCPVGHRHHTCVCSPSRMGRHVLALLQEQARHWQQPGGRKTGRHPELTGEGGRASLVLLAAEVGGRWSAETAQFLVALSNSKAEAAPEQKSFSPEVRKLGNEGDLHEWKPQINNGCIRVLPEWRQRHVERRIQPISRLIESKTHGSTNWNVQDRCLEDFLAGSA